MRSFFAGAFFLAPLWFLMAFLVVKHQYTVGTKVERDTVAAQLSSAEFGQDFDKRWAEMGGNPASCSSAQTATITRLRKRLASLNKELAQDRQGDKKNVSNLGAIIKKEDASHGQH